MRQYDTSKRQLVAKICDYVDAAVANIDLMAGVSRRGSYVKIKTFAEAVMQEQLYPEPRTAVQVLPPPMVRR